MKTARCSRIGMLTLALSATLTPAAADTVGWRMDGDGRYPETNPPIEWSPSENVVWKTAMPSWSNASPVLLREKSLIFVLSEPDEILAVDAEDGKIAWKASTGDVTGERVKTHDANGWTSATPVTDGERVFTVFGSGVVAAYTTGGERLWAREVEEPDHRWGHSASPALGGGHLIVHLVDLIALDPATGKEAWRAESKVAWGSPVVTRIGDAEVVITPAGDVFRADSGERVATEIGGLEYATPVIQDGVIYFIEKRATAVKLPAALGEPFETLWQSRLKGSRHYASSLIHDGLIYAVSREEEFSILDASTGKLVLERRLDLGSGANSAYPSISLAGGHVYLSTENGTTVVLEPGREYKELARNSIGEFRGTPVFVEDRMIVRAFDYLYCFGSSSANAPA
jgi:outer membrane protein assembly factor BamB